MRRITELAAFASTHHGLVTVGVARRLGIPERSWHRAIASGVLEPLHHGVARLPGAPDTFEQRALAAVWGAGDGAIASHRTAARLWGVERPDDDPIDVILTRRSREATLGGVAVHRPCDLRSLRPIPRRGVPVTDPLRTVVDLGAVDPQRVGPTVEALLVSRLVTPAALRGALYRHSKKGRRGVGPLRAVLQSWEMELVADSALELRMAELLRRHRLPPARFHAVIEGFEVDFHFVGTPVVIECDGYASHGLDRDQFEFDRLRNSMLSAAGYVIVHVTWAQVTGAAGQVAARIEANLRRWAPDLLAAHRQVA